ncbi:MAG: helix-turn-helix domain-containing protein [Opitutales bacterium]|nr:helix-turn-helix domain-containing protein [Opitutales bacterium]
MLVKTTTRNSTPQTGSGSTINTQKAVFTVPEAASYLTICERKLRELLAEGEIRHSRIGRRVVISIAALEAFLEDNLV